MDTSAPRPIPTRVWWIAAVTGAGAFLAMADSTLVNLALESIRRDLHAPLATVQWVVTAYLVALTVSLPAQAWLGRRLGHGRVWAGALAVFVAASVACGLAPGAWTLVGARVVQGLAAGLMVPAGQAVIGATARPDQLGRLMGALGVVIALGPAVGPALGGLVLEAGSWRWLFLLNVPVGAGALVAARGLVPPGTRTADHRLDRRGLVLLATGLPLFLFAATEVGAGGTTPLLLVAAVTGAALCGGFLRTAARRTHPLVDLSLLAGDTFGPATAVNLLTGANMYAGLLVLPLWAQEVIGLGPTRTGLLLLAMGMGSAAALYVAGRLTDRHGARPVVIAGAWLLVASTAPLLLPEAPTGWWLVAALAARGAALALAQMPALTAAYASASEAQMGDATTLVNIAQRIGGAVGAAGIVVVLTRAGSASYTWSFAVLAALGLAILLPASSLARHPRATMPRDAPAERA